jgi:hypothetical protein
MQVISQSIKTHLWLGEEILKDLRYDNKLTIYIDGQPYYYDIPESTLQSLISYPGAYLSGLMGPDAFPDPAVGQLVVHPGLFDESNGEINGWQTDDWLKHLNLGYSNINTISTGLSSVNSAVCLNELEDEYLYYEVSKAIEFNLSDIEITTESRESLIDSALSVTTMSPNSRTAQFAASSPSSTLNNKLSNLRMSLELDNFEYNLETSIMGGSSFINPMRDKCYLTISGSKNEAFSNGYIGHAISDMWAHTYVNMYSGGAFNTSNGIEDEKRHILLEKYIAQYTPALSTYASNISPPTGFLVDKLILNNTAVSQYQKSSSASHIVAVNSLYNKLGDYANSNVLKSMDRVALNYIAEQYLNISLNNKELDKVAEILNKAKILENKTIDEIQSITNQLKGEVNRLIIQDSELKVQLITAIDSAVSQHIEVKERVLLLTTKINSLTVRIGNKIAKKVCKRWFFLGPLACKIFKEWNRAQKRLLKLKESAIKERSRLERRLSNTTTKNLKDVIIQSSSILVETLTEINNQTQLTVDLAQRFNSDINLIRAYFLGWQRDVKLAMMAYTLSWNEVIKSSAYGNLNTSEFERWIACYGPSLAGIPSEVSSSICSGSDYFYKLTNMLDKLSTGAIHLALPIGGEVVVDFKDDINNKLKGIADNALDKAKDYLIMNVLDEEFYELYKVFDGEVTDYELNTLFANNRDNSLIKIPDMASRVRAEMQAVEGGEFNPDAYPVIFNSLQLMKLSLLDTESLNDVLNIAVTGSPQYMPTVNTYYDDNVIYNVLRSIDGNHQWLNSAPAYPRNAENPDLSPIYLREYGFSAYEGKGFLIWKNDTLREFAFNKLFKGPLSQGLEQPSELGLYDILPERYPYRGCRNEPFPMNDISYKCGARLLDWLIPVLFINN